MSWSRILRFARERQVPVIVTNETGEDPLILLSLDQLEEALGGAVDPSPAPAPSSPRPPTPSFVPESVPEPVLPEGSGEFALEEQELGDELGQQEVGVETDQAQHESRIEEEVLTDIGFTTQEEEGVEQEEAPSSEVYGEIMVAPHIEVSPLVQEVPQGGGVTVADAGTPKDLGEGVKEVSTSEETAPAVIWEEGELPMPQEGEEVGGVKEDSDEGGSDIERGAQEGEAGAEKATPRTVDADVSLEERFFLDF